MISDMARVSTDGESSTGSLSLTSWKSNLNVEGNKEYRRVRRDGDFFTVTDYHLRLFRGSEIPSSVWG